MKLSLIRHAFALAIIGGAIIITAWKGDTDWMVLALFAVVAQLPGARALKNLFKGKPESGA